LARLRNRGRWLVSVWWLAVSAALHGIYDFIAIAFEGAVLGLAAAIVVALWVWRLVTLRNLSRS
jgi:uncharacterized membrane protein YccC